MAYINAKTVKEFRKSIKKAFPNCKFSIRTVNHSTVAVSLLEAPYSYRELFDQDHRLEEKKKFLLYRNNNDIEKAEKEGKRIMEKEEEEIQNGDFTYQLNSKYIENYKGKVQEIFEKVKDIVNAGNYDNSNAQIDHFDVGWYLSFEIGRFGRGYKVVK